MLKWIKTDVKFVDSRVPDAPFTITDYTPTSKILISRELSEMKRVHIFDFGKELFVNRLNIYFRTEKLVITSKPVTFIDTPYMYALTCSTRVDNAVYFVCNSTSKCTEIFVEIN